MATKTERGKPIPASTELWAKRLQPRVLTARGTDCVFGKFLPLATNYFVQLFSLVAFV